MFDLKASIFAKLRKPSRSINFSIQIEEINVRDSLRNSYIATYTFSFNERKVK